MTKAEVFNAAYKASRDPRVLALLSIDEGSRYDAAYALALKGLVIDNEIDVRGASPFLEMEYRVNDGMKWGPSILQPNLQVSLVGNQQPNRPFAPYDSDAPVPEMGCPYSIDPADFKPFPVPVTLVTVEPTINPTPAAGEKLVGAAKGGSWWDLSDLARRKALADGFVWSLEGDGHSYMLHVQSFGVKIWQRIS